MSLKRRFVKSIGMPNKRGMQCIPFEIMKDITRVEPLRRRISVPISRLIVRQTSFSWEAMGFGFPPTYMYAKEEGVQLCHGLAAHPATVK